MAGREAFTPVTGGVPAAQVQFRPRRGVPAPAEKTSIDKYKPWLLAGAVLLVGFIGLQMLGQRKRKREGTNTNGNPELDTPASQAMRFTDPGLYPVGGQQQQFYPPQQGQQGHPLQQQYNQFMQQQQQMQPQNSRFMGAPAQPFLGQQGYPSVDGWVMSPQQPIGQPSMQMPPPQTTYAPQPVQPRMFDAGSGPMPMTGDLPQPNPTGSSGMPRGGQMPQQGLQGLPQGGAYGAGSGIAFGAGGGDMPHGGGGGMPQIPQGYAGQGGGGYSGGGPSGFTPL